MAATEIEDRKADGSAAHVENEQGSTEPPLNTLARSRLHLEKNQGQHLLLERRRRLLALRVRRYKLAFMEQHGEASPTTPTGVWQSEFTKLRVPNLYDLLADPFERATSSIYYADWQIHRVFIQILAQVIPSFTVSDVMDKIVTASPQGN